MEIEFEFSGGNAPMMSHNEAVDEMQRMALQWEKIMEVPRQGPPQPGQVEAAWQRGRSAGCSPEELLRWCQHHHYPDGHHCHCPATMYEIMFGIGMLASAFMMLLVGCSILGCRQLRKRRRTVTKTADYDAQDRGVEAATLIMTEDDLVKKMPNPADDIAVVDNAAPIVAVVVDSPASSYGWTSFR